MFTLLVVLFFGVGLILIHQFFTHRFYHQLEIFQEKPYHWEMDSNETALFASRKYGLNHVSIDASHQQNSCYDTQKNEIRLGIHVYKNHSFFAILSSLHEVIHAFQKKEYTFLFTCYGCIEKVKHWTRIALLLSFVLLCLKPNTFHFQWLLLFYFTLRIVPSILIFYLEKDAWSKAYSFANQHHIVSPYRSAKRTKRFIFSALSTYIFVILKDVLFLIAIYQFLRLF